MSRTTRTQLEGTLTRLALAAGLPRATPTSRVGLSLDHAECYGGYKVIMTSADRTESDVFGADRCSAGEMWSRMSFAIQVLGAARRATPESAMPECLGHSAGTTGAMGETVYCDGSCRMP